MLALGKYDEVSSFAALDKINLIALASPSIRALVRIGRLSSTVISDVNIFSRISKYPCLTDQ